MKSNFFYNEAEQEYRIGRIIGAAIIALFILAGLASSFYIVETGEVGLLKRFGAVTGDVKKPGLHFVIPFVNNVTMINTRTQKQEVQTLAFSKDLQEVNVNLAINYNIPENTAIQVYNNLNQDWESRVILPFTNEVIKGVVAQYDASSLIAQRIEVGEKMRIELTQKLIGYGINVSELSLTDLDFSDAFTSAIEAKVTATQRALESQEKLKQIQFESEQAIVKAQGEAEALRLKAESLRQNPEIIQLEAISKWDGKFPTYMLGDSVPFINLK